jgi:hypothetical protein
MLITEKVANRTMQAMAYNRDGFKNRLSAHLHGALTEYYKYTLAKKNDLWSWTDHWHREVNRLLDQEFSNALIKEIKGFKDRLKACNEVVAYTKQIDRHFRVVARNMVLHDYGLLKLEYPLTDTDTEVFWQRVELIIQETLSDLK